MLYPAFARPEHQFTDLHTQAACKSFYDLSRNQASRKSNWSTQSSYGGDLIFDWNVLRMSYPLTTGVRLIQPIDYGKFQVEALFSISF